MSQHSENDSDDDDCEYFLQPVSNQYNISEKIKEANQQLYRCEQLQRSQPKVRFRDHQLVDYEPEEGNGLEIMERRRSSSAGSRNSFSKIENHDENSSDIDDGYIDDEVLDASVDERLIIETIEIEEVCEEIEVLDISDNNNRAFVNDIHESLDSEETKYEADDFYKDDDSTRDVAVKSAQKNGREKSSSSKKIFRTRINPIGNVPVDERRARNKKCCEYKETDEYKQKLPKYNGFYSHYGLSKDEIERREYKMLTNVEVKRRRSSQYTEKQEHLAKTNEEAFAKWLQKKMRNPVSRSNPVNMYDMKPSKRKQQSRKLPQRKQRFTIQRQMETEEHDDEESKTDPEEEDDDEVEVENIELKAPEPSENGEDDEEQEGEEEEEETEKSDS